MTGITVFNYGTLTLGYNYVVRKLEYDFRLGRPRLGALRRRPCPRVMLALIDSPAVFAWSSPAQLVVAGE